MITFDLQCANSHTFEGWFEDSKAYENQKKEGLLICPICSDTNVNKVLSSFAIKSSHNSSPVFQDDEKMRDLRKRFVDFVEQNFDNVGSKFTEEALKIHYGVAEPRNIRGVSSEKEEKILQKEGIKFLKIPVMETPPDTGSTNDS